MKSLETRVLIIGGGVTGTGLARDLALRGVDCLLTEKSDINAGASGANHGLLHSGARYAVSDPAAARECSREREILKRIAGHCIQETGGLFVATAWDDQAYPTLFAEACRQAEVWVEPLAPDRARALEPELSPNITTAYKVRDGVIDPFMLALDHLAQALSLGARVRRNWQAEAMEVRAGRVEAVRFRDRTARERVAVRPEVIINAAGAWAGLVASLAGVGPKLVFSKGTLLVTRSRLTRRVINRLRPPADADILAPGGTVSILGTTSSRVESPDNLRPTAREADRIIEDARAMLPVLDRTRFIRAYAGVRPLVSTGSDDDRAISRDFSLLDHGLQGVENLITITGGKLTTFRLMAEKAADLACRKLGVEAPCRTAVEPLPSSGGRWTDPDRAPRAWIRTPRTGDTALCECELVSASVVDRIIAELDRMSGRSILKALNLRSRMGKGGCQGGFCGLRVVAHLADQERLSGRAGHDQLKAFIERRWRGFSPVLWGSALAQAELQEAVHHGFLGLGLEQPEEPEGRDEPGPA